MWWLSLRSDRFPFETGVGVSMDDDWLISADPFGLQMTDFEKHRLIQSTLDHSPPLSRSSKSSLSNESTTSSRDALATTSTLSILESILLANERDLKHVDAEMKFISRMRFKAATLRATMSENHDAKVARCRGQVYSLKVNQLEKSMSDIMRERAHLEEEQESLLKLSALIKRGVQCTTCISVRSLLHSCLLMIGEYRTDAEKRTHENTTTCDDTLFSQDHVHSADAVLTNVDDAGTGDGGREDRELVTGLEKMLGRCLHLIAFDGDHELSQQYLQFTNTHVNIDTFNHSSTTSVPAFSFRDSTFPAFSIRDSSSPTLSTNNATTLQPSPLKSLGIKNNRDSNA